jgi:hypothetical protein
MRLVKLFAESVSRGPFELGMRTLTSAFCRERPVYTSKTNCTAARKCMLVYIDIQSPHAEPFSSYSAAT